MSAAVSEQHRSAFTLQIVMSTERVDDRSAGFRQDAAGTSVTVDSPADDR
jgi:hypothetical protein